ncbi:homoserine kinase [Oceanibacterium hippocampi]|uniref:Homoserine kinase n=1 Tax=Oceanibacterium hippocampi TaxID=745714 RepID=A0A1Y5SB36_9PROT|nr:homoserine kinase [Oceanibacterium hippocampi]SLN33680.1 Homoserine kinase [Oceanibacterium hippocampi]
MAVYTEIGDDELDDLLHQYDIGRALSCKGIAEGVENSNYLLHTTGGYFILTLYEKRVNPADLPFFLGLMDHLAGRQVPCPTPIHGRDGAALRAVAGRPAAIIAFAEGRALTKPGPDHCQRLGAALAELHLAGSDFTRERPNALSVGGWRPLFEASRARADEVAPGLAAELEGELAALEAGWPGGLPEGVIHADLFPDNVLFLDGRINAFIDFYFACNDAFAYDLAICLNAWCFEKDGSFNATKARKLMAGYQGVRPLEAAEMAALPLLARGAAIRFLLTRLYDWLNQIEGALVKPKNPLEYLAKLRFHRDAGGPGAYGLDA